MTYTNTRGISWPTAIETFQLILVSVGSTQHTTFKNKTIAWEMLSFILKLKCSGRRKCLLPVFSWGSKEERWIREIHSQKVPSKTTPAVGRVGIRPLKTLLSQSLGRGEGKGETHCDTCWEGCDPAETGVRSDLSVVCKGRLKNLICVFLSHFPKQFRSCGLLFLPTIN